MSELTEIHKNPVVYSIEGMEAAADVSSYVYKSVEDLDLHMDVYTPRQPVRVPAPIVILVHGDGPNEDLMHAREWGQYVSYGQLLAASGLAAVTFNHRSTDQLTRMDVAGEDITDAFNFVRANAREWGLDGDRLCIWAISAGVPYGVSAAVRDLPADVRCVVAYYGYLSLQHVRDELQDVRQETLEQHSPTYFLNQYRNQLPPMLIVRAGNDTAVINDSIGEFVTQAISAGADFSLLNHAEAQHGFDIFEDTPRTHAIIRETLEFVQANLSAE